MTTKRRLEGKTAVITGGTTGIGLATAQLFHQEGARVLATGVNAETLAQAQRLLPPEVQVVRSDAGKLEDIVALASEVKRRFDTLDVLFVNAGIFQPGLLESVSEDAFDRSNAINYKGAFFVVQQLRPLLRRGSALVINTSILDRKGVPAVGLYSATKGALSALVRSLAAELGPAGIRVNAISPGPVETAIWAKSGLPAEAAAQQAQALTRAVPLGRFGSAAEVARSVLFLASEDASYVHGEELVVDGGLSAA
jgi:NAD(P)-dependent dehydrogenase (short-subunit alcohol dehydrogenase family)